MQTIDELVRTFAERGDAPACELRAFRTLHFSYHEVSLLIHSIVVWLAGKGIGKGDRVLIWAPNSPWWVVGCFGVWLRGGVVVPVDFASDNKRARWIAEKGKAKFAFASVLKTGVDLGVETVMMEELEGLLGGSFGLSDSGTRVASSSNEARSASAAQSAFGGTVLAPSAEGSVTGNLHPVTTGSHIRQGVEECEISTRSAQTQRPRPSGRGNGVHSGGMEISERPRAQTSREGREGEVVKESDVALLIYTSGTTGEPKGVPLTHLNLMANVQSLIRHVEVRPSDVFLSVLPLSHSFEMMAGCLVPLAAGAKIVYLKTVKPSAIFDALATGTITVFASVPRLIALLQGSIEQKFEHLRLAGVLRGMRSIARKRARRARKKIFWFIHKKIGPHFRYFVSGGAALDIEVARFWDDLGFTVLEGYGLTECSPVLTANQPGKVRLGTVGMPVPGVTVRIAADGEIEAKGPNIFSGYADNPRASGEAFTADGWLKTGDVGSIDTDGYLTIKTRKKDMIVTAAGVNVYPEDVERELVRVKGVKECAVIGIDRGRGEEVHAVLVLEAGREAAEVVAAANQSLDTLQAITGWTVWRGELPKTTTMKVKKSEVKERVSAELKEGAKDSDPSAPMGGDKRGLVIQIIGSVVKQDPRAIRDEDKLVTDLHLTSLDRADLLARLEQEARLDLPEDAVGKDTTVGDLVDIIAQRKKLHARNHLRMGPLQDMWCKVRAFIIAGSIRPYMRWLGRLNMNGVEHVAALRGPYILASNHVSYFDQPMTLAALPPRIAGRVATAAREDFFFDASFGWGRAIWGRICFEFSSFLLGAFLLPQGGQVAESMKFMGALADRGIPILIYPEGERSWDGTPLPLQPGLARMVQELRLPVVPVRIQGMEKIFPRGSARIRRGHAMVSFGPPLRFAANASADAITKTVGDAIQACAF